MSEMSYHCVFYSVQAIDDKLINIIILILLLCYKAINAN